MSTNSDVIKVREKMGMQDAFFQKYFVYYQKLDTEEKKRFLRRINIFISKKKFFGRKGFEITPEVKLMIAGAAVQITFGLEQFLMPRFHTILVYEDIFLNYATNRYHRGEVNPKGIIVFSWKDFLRGYANHEDKRNLGLHEMAHAFHLNVLHTDFHDVSLDEYFEKIKFLSQKEILKIRNSDHHFFRDYAKTNVFEFFAVAMEYYFEAPNEFYDELPELYRYMCLLLNQDLANSKAYGLSEYVLDALEGAETPLLDHGTYFENNPWVFVINEITYIFLAVFIPCAYIFRAVEDGTLSMPLYIGACISIAILVFLAFAYVHFNKIRLYPEHLTVLTWRSIKRQRIAYSQILFIRKTRKYTIYHHEGKTVKRISAFIHDTPSNLVRMDKFLKSKQVVFKRMS